MGGLGCQKLTGKPEIDFFVVKPYKNGKTPKSSIFDDFGPQNRGSRGIPGGPPKPGFSGSRGVYLSKTV